MTGGPDLVTRDLNPLNKRTDVATGWSDHGARWMAPETGRWLSPDPPVIGPDAKFMAAPWALHPFQYVNQNPVMYWDPDGRDTTGLSYMRPYQETEVPKPVAAKAYTDEEARGIENQLNFSQNGLGQTVTGMMGGPYASYMARQAWNAAKQASEAEFKGTIGGLNDREDAFRHGYASYVLTQSTGAEFAKAAGDAHERSYANPHSERVMDLYNNHIGRMLALDPSNRDRDPAAVIREALANGQFMTAPLNIDNSEKIVGKYDDYKK